jgi:YD repeat-containing protein
VEKSEMPIAESTSCSLSLIVVLVTDGSVYTLTIPSTGGYAPDSDILAANDSVNGNWIYAYDSFNRLCASNQASQTPLRCTSTNNTGQKAFTYAYDRFGNRWNQTVTAGNGSAPSFGFNANNQLDTFCTRSTDVETELIFSMSGHITKRQ